MGTTAEKLNKLLETKSSIKQAIIDKGVDVSDTDTFESYAGKIGQISGGGGIPNYIAPKNNVNGVYQADNTATSFSLNGATSVDDYGLCRAFYYCYNLETADFSSLTTINKQYAMYYCFGGGLSKRTKLRNISFPALKTISGYSAFHSVFYGNQGLVSADFPVLETISGTQLSIFCQCKYLETLSMPSLKKIESCGSMCQSCERLISVDLSSLNSMTSRLALQNAFYGCTSLKELRFPAITTATFGTTEKNQFMDMCGRCTDIVLHFPSNVESVIRGLTGYSDTQPFGATSGQVLFDLEPTE